MVKAYRILSKVEAPLLSHADFAAPKAIYTLIQEDGRRIRASLPRRQDWEVGYTVRIDEGVVLDNIVL